MTARSQMKYRATVERLVDGTTNPDGHTSYEGWAVLYSSLPCYIWDVEHLESVTVNQTSVMVTVKAIVPVDTDILASDRIGDIKLANGTPHLDGNYRVNGVTKRQRSHLELQLEKVY